MEASELGRIADRYARDGYVSGVRIMGEETAAVHRRRLEEAEAQVGLLHYKAKVHTVLRSPFELASDPRALDLVEAILGPNILLHNVTYIIKEPHSKAHVSWHQDLTYWGFDCDDQVSMWLALAPATDRSGCMRMIPGSHRQGNFEHSTGALDADNVLLQGQTVNGVDEARAVHCHLRPGEASFHHGRTLHASMSNNSDDRRIGLNVQYLATHVRQVKHDRDTTILLRGVDEYRNFGEDVPAAHDLDVVALQRFEELDRQYKETAGSH